MTTINEVTPPGVPEKDVEAMKPSFKKQYGDRWKSVMYATLWKKHGQKEELTVQEMREYIWEHAHESRKEIKDGKRVLAIQQISENEERLTPLKAWLDLDSMSNDLVEHHYMNIRAVSEGSNFLKPQEREGFEAFKSGKAHAENPHPKGSQKAYHWTSGHKLGAVMKSRKVFKESEHQDRTKAYQKDKSFSMKPRGDDFSMVGNDSGYVYKTHSNKTLMRQHVDDQNNLKNPPKSKLVINKKIEGEPKNKDTIAQQKLGHLMGKGQFSVKEDAVDDQLKKHGMSRVSLAKTVTNQRQQFQGRPNPPQHAVKGKE